MADARDRFEANHQNTFTVTRPLERFDQFALIAMMPSSISFLRLANLNNEIVDQLSRLRRQSTSKTPDSLPDRAQVCR